MALSKNFADYYKTKHFGRRYKVRTSGELLPIDTNFVSILLLVYAVGQ